MFFFNSLNTFFKRLKWLKGHKRHKLIQGKSPFLSQGPWPEKGDFPWRLLKKGAKRGTRECPFSNHLYLFEGCLLFSPFCRFEKGDKGQVLFHPFPSFFISFFVLFVFAGTQYYFADIDKIPWALRYTQYVHQAGRGGGSSDITKQEAASQAVSWQNCAAINMSAAGQRSQTRKWLT